MTHAVGVDFDGVIHAYSEGWKDGSVYDEPVAGAFRALECLLDDYAVFIHTTRDPVQVANWLSDRGCPVTVTEPEGDFWDDRTQLLVTRRKYPAVAYIDDRAIRFENWDQALTDLKKLTAK